MSTYPCGHKETWSSAQLFLSHEHCHFDDLIADLSLTIQSPSKDKIITNLFSNRAGTQQPLVREKLNSFTLSFFMHSENTAFLTCRSLITDFGPYETFPVSSNNDRS